MKLKPIIRWGSFTSWAIIPTILIGERWAYFYWLQGQIGVRWEK